MSREMSSPKKPSRDQSRCGKKKGTEIARDEGVATSRARRKRRRDVAKHFLERDASIPRAHIPSRRQKQRIITNAYRLHQSPQLRARGPDVLVLFPSPATSAAATSAAAVTAATSSIATVTAAAKTARKSASVRCFGHCCSPSRCKRCGCKNTAEIFVRTKVPRRKKRRKKGRK